MALYVVNEKGKEFQWHVGERDNTMSTAGLRELLADFGEVIVLQADGDELQLINDKIVGVRKAPHKRVVRWTGEDAMFIIDNI